MGINMKKNKIVRFQTFSPPPNEAHEYGFCSGMVVCISVFPYIDGYSKHLLQLGFQ